MAKLLLPAILGLGVATATVAPGAGGDPAGTTSTGTGTSTPAPGATITVTTQELVDGKPATWWHRKAVQARKDANARARTIRRLRRTLQANPTVMDAIALAATAYHVPGGTLKRKAWCESRFSPAARNPSGATGLFQFLPSTWRTTPYAGFSPWDPFASALAASWMHAVGRGGEWSCR